MLTYSLALKDVEQLLQTTCLLNICKVEIEIQPIAIFNNVQKLVSFLYIIILLSKQLRIQRLYDEVMLSQYFKVVKKKKFEKKLETDYFVRKIGADPKTLIVKFLKNLLSIIMEESCDTK